ncbi:hypothetical protein [Streptomyces sp. NBC_01429]|uniref:hypothetical protein n=1 Tax=Streptomyces sp. NBC_01429 TaxID=2903862 RepID=UPI002E2A377A|nr:hypothetical protein [Streptomyces sp. NBC_01429]
MFAAILFLKDEESDAFALGSDGEVRWSLAAPMGWGSALCGSVRCLVALCFGGGDEGLGDAQGSALQGFGEPGRHMERGEFREAPGRDVDQLDFVAAVGAVSVEFLRVWDLAGLAGGVDP